MCSYADFDLFLYHPNIPLSFPLEANLNIHNCCLSCYQKCYPHDFFFSACTKSFPLYSNTKVKVNHSTGHPHIRFVNIHTQRHYKLCPKIWKLNNLVVDDLNANSYLQYTLTDYVGLVLSGASVVLFYEHYIFVYFVYLSCLYAQFLYLSSNHRKQSFFSDRVACHIV